MITPREQIRMDVSAERFRQDGLWGVQQHNDEMWLTILVEELGEVARAMMQESASRVKEELVQVAAVAQAWAECLESKPQ